MRGAASKDRYRQCVGEWSVVSRKERERGGRQRETEREREVASRERERY